MIRLEFGSSFRVNSKRKLIAECNTIEEAFVEMMKYIEKMSFKSYYQRVNLPNENDENKEMEVDFGSYTLFFYVCGFTDEEYNEWLGKNRYEKNY